MDLTLKLAPYEVINIQETPMMAYIPDGVKAIKAPEYWARGYKGQGIVIAVMDTGCEVDHPDLRDRIIGGRNFTKEDRGNPDKYSDYNGHGTHVAGIIAASGTPDGVFGVAPKASLLILKIMNRKGVGSYESLIEAIRYAMEVKVNIISLSLGGSMDLPGLKEAIKAAVAQGITVVCAASNEGDGNPDTQECAYPGCYEETIAVGAQQGKGVARFSNTNNQIDLIAPGVEIISTYIKGQYAQLSGTSMAAPHVTGALALLMNWGQENFRRDLTEAEVYAQLIKRTISLGLPKMQEGNGILNLTSPEILEILLKRNTLDDLE